MRKADLDAFSRAAALAAAVSLSACATAQPAPAAKPAHADPLPVAKSASADAAPAQAPASPAPFVAPAMPSGPLTRISGVVISGDSVGHALTIKDYSGRTHTFRIAGGASLTRGGDDAVVGLEGVSAGDRVRLKVGGGDIVASLHVLVNPAQ
jgi:hypothetical protein